MSFHRDLPPDAVAAFDQLQAELREQVQGMADAAARGGATCCTHPLCPGQDILRSVALTVMAGGGMTLMGYLTCALRLLGDARLASGASR